MLNEKYKECLTTLKGLVSYDEYKMTILCNAQSHLNNYLSDINWIGFYLIDNDKLILGPFSGNPACTIIDIKKGVCGKCARLNEVIIVPNVHEFEGHIACDCKSNSEICIPININGKFYGLLDIDSPSFDRFKDEEKEFLTSAVKIIEEALEKAFKSILI